MMFMYLIIPGHEESWVQMVDSKVENGKLPDAVRSSYDFLFVQYFPETKPVKLFSFV